MFSQKSPVFPSKGPDFLYIHVSGSNGSGKGNLSRKGSIQSGVQSTSSIFTKLVKKIVKWFKLKVLGIHQITADQVHIQLQCAAACCSVCCSVLRSVAVFESKLKCSIEQITADQVHVPLQSVAVCCSVWVEPNMLGVGQTSNTFCNMQSTSKNSHKAACC